MEPRDYGLAALSALQSGILNARETGFAGRDLKAFAEEVADDLVAALEGLDMYLTGKGEGRRHGDDHRQMMELLTGNRDFHVHLSDGGYSRLTLRLEEGFPVVLDRSLSRDPVKKKWAALFPPS